MDNYGQERRNQEGKDQRIYRQTGKAMEESEESLSKFGVGYFGVRY
jgi:hypothetical protein